MNTYNFIPEGWDNEITKINLYDIGLSEEELKTLLIKMQVFQAGLSIMATNESFALILTDEMIIEM